jgi:hypothetical protein
VIYVMPGHVPGIHVFRAFHNRQDVDGRGKPGHDSGKRIARSGPAMTWGKAAPPLVRSSAFKAQYFRLELVVQADQSQLECVAEVASVAGCDALIEICGAATGYVGLSEIDVAEFRARGPVLGEHVLDTDTRCPADFRLFLSEGSNLPGTKNPRADRVGAILDVPDSCAAGD